MQLDQDLFLQLCASSLPQPPPRPICQQLASHAQSAFATTTSKAAFGYEFRRLADLTLLQITNPHPRGNIKATVALVADICYDAAASTPAGAP